MKNSFINFFRSKIKLKVEGKHIERFIRKLATNNIELLNISYPSRNIVFITIKKDDYDKVMRLKSIYEIDVVGAGGLVKIRSVLRSNQILILFVIIGISLLILLSNIIFKIEVIHTSSQVREFLTNELKSYGLDIYSVKKSFKQIEKIKNKILDKYPDKIEWLEIETVGTKYVVRVELRKIPDKKEINTIRNIVAKKDALIKKVTATKGMIVKNINSYVKKGDIIISGNISLNEEIKGSVDATGDVFGEVWYTTTVEYPFRYYEEKTTGNKKNIISVKFLNKSFDFFSKFKDKKITTKTILENKLLPIKIVKEKQEELIIIDQFLTEEEAIDKALLLAKEKMNKNLKKDEYIISDKVLKTDIKQDKIVIDVFFSIYENITDYKDIIIEEDKLEDNTR